MRKDFHLPEINYICSGILETIGMLMLNSDINMQPNNHKRLFLQSCNKTSDTNYIIKFNYP